MMLQAIKKKENERIGTKQQQILQVVAHCHVTYSSQLGLQPTIIFTIFLINWLSEKNTFTVVHDQEKRQIVTF